MEKQDFYKAEREDSKTIDAVVSIDNVKNVAIRSNEFETPEMQALLAQFKKSLAGRMRMEEDGSLRFTAYGTGQNPPTVQQREQVGDVKVKRTPRAVNFTLSLSTTMSESLMCLTIMEQSSALVQALHNGLYTRMVSGQQSATTSASTRAA